MKPVILNIKGTSGSGKTTLARKILSYPHEEIKGYKKLRNSVKEVADAYKVDMSQEGIELPVYVIGSYNNTCGGCDTINTQEEIVERVKKYYPSGHILIEGLLLSGTGKNGYVPRELSKTGALVIGWLNTPLDVCIERVKARRLAAGNTKPFDTTCTTRTYKSSYSSSLALHEQKMAKVITLPYQDAFPRVLKVFANQYPT